MPNVQTGFGTATKFVPGVQLGSSAPISVHPLWIDGVTVSIMGVFHRAKRQAAYPLQDAAEQSTKGSLRGLGWMKFWGRAAAVSPGARVTDPTNTLRVRAMADPESDTAEELLIDREREGVEDPRGEGRLG